MLSSHHDTMEIIIGKNRNAAVLNCYSAARWDVIAVLTSYMSLTAKVKLDRGPPEAPLNVNVSLMYGESDCTIAATVAMLALVISEVDPANHGLSCSATGGLGHQLAFKMMDCPVVKTLVCEAVRQHL